MQNIPRQTIVSARLTEAEKLLVAKAVVRDLQPGVCENTNQWMRQALLDKAFGSHVPESMRKRLLKG